MYIQISHLSKSFQGEEILKDVTFTLGGRERVGLVGSNGSGKTTIFRILVGDEVPDRGTINIQPKGAKIGYLPQVADPGADSLSAGQRTKKSLEELLSQSPDILLLDEPTNHLDWDGLYWLEEIVQDFSGPVLLVSHDRQFLDNVVDEILELENGSLKNFGGNYTFYKEQKAIEEEANRRKYIEQEKQTRRLKERVAIVKNRANQLEARTTGTDHYVRRKAAKAVRSALSLEKRIARELARSTITKPEKDWELKAIFTPKKESSDTVAQIKGVSKSFPDREILDNLSLLIRRDERVALIGDNGSGKTTILKLLLSQIYPDSGTVSYGNNVDIGYLSQDHQELNGNQLVIDELTSSGADKTESYKLLQRFLLTPEKITQPVNLLSSGEKSKLLLAKIMVSRPNFIILDEPTNHLDIPSREAIEKTIYSFPSTLIVVSHDRYFLEQIGITTFYFLADGKLTQL